MRHKQIRATATDGEEASQIDAKKIDGGSGKQSNETRNGWTCAPKWGNRRFDGRTDAGRPTRQFG
jgi:hypothetical protein